MLDGGPDPRGANSDPTDVFRANKKHENIQKLSQLSQLSFKTIIYLFTDSWNDWNFCAFWAVKMNISHYKVFEVKSTIFDMYNNAVLIEFRRTD